MNTFFPNVGQIKALQNACSIEAATKAANTILDMARDRQIAMPDKGGYIPFGVKYMKEEGAVVVEFTRKVFNEERAKCFEQLRRQNEVREARREIWMGKVDRKLGKMGFKFADTAEITPQEKERRLQKRLAAEARQAARRQKDAETRQGMKGMGGGSKKSEGKKAA